MKRPEIYVWLDDDRARLVTWFFRGRVYVHLKIRKWGMAVLHDAHALWPQIRLALKSLGYESVHTYNTVEDAKWMRFVGHFGFKERGRRNGVVVMEASNA